MIFALAVLVQQAQLNDMLTPKRYQGASSFQTGVEVFYGTSGAPLTMPSAGPWTYGFWNPIVGYGFGHPNHHGLSQR